MSQCNVCGERISEEQATATAAGPPRLSRPPWVSEQPAYFNTYVELGTN